MKPYYDRNGITIYLGDCREVLPTLPEKSVDLVLTDPPYPSLRKWEGIGTTARMGLGRKGGPHTEYNIQVAHASCNLRKFRGKLPSQTRLPFDSGDDLGDRDDNNVEAH